MSSAGEMERPVPEVSVVMGVYNSADTLDEVMRSVLDQQRIELEFIVVDDGSTDGSGVVLDNWAARDPRVVVLHQENAGLTISLQRACALARAELIARQDAGGDRSLPGRLRAQADALRQRPAAVAATGGHRLVAMDGIALCDINPTEAEIHRGLTSLEVPGLRGILHASSMFRAAPFHSVGGYRSMFRVAQDLDLWLRLYEVGEFAFVDQVIYEVRHDIGSLSAVRSAEQLSSAIYAADCAKARRSGLPEPSPGAGGALPFVPSVSMRDCRAAYHYFVAGCLRDRNARVARRHFLKAWRTKPWMLKALFLAVTTW